MIRLTKKIKDLAYRAIERETFSEEREIQKIADNCMDRFSSLSKDEYFKWAAKELEQKSLEE